MIPTCHEGSDGGRGETPAISLSVEDGNRARVLYERLGFVKVGRNGGSDTLLLEF